MYSDHKDIVHGIRTQLSPFLGGSELVPPTPRSNFAAHYSQPEEVSSRFVRKIPKKNYEDLSKMVPISWL